MTRLFVLTFGILATHAHAAPLFPAGAESKAAGMESTLHADGPPAVLYNPANLEEPRPASTKKTKGDARAKRAEPYAELGFVNVQYTYEHPQFDPVNVSVSSPTATLGYQHQVLDRVSVAGVLFPSAAGKTEIPGLPRKVGGSLMAVEVENEDQVFDLGVGAGVRVAPGLSLGLSVVRTQEKHSLRATAPGNDNALQVLTYRNAFHRPVAGARYEPTPFFTTSAAFRPALVKTYKGSQTAATDDSAGAPRITGYEPATLSLGAGGRLQRYEVGVEAQRQQWSKGRGVVKNGIYADEPDADLKDVTQLGVNAGYHLPQRSAAVTVGYAQLPSPWGDGHDDGDLDSHVYGVDFGQLNGMDLKVLSLGGRVRLMGADLSVAASRAQGERVVSGGGDNEGYYSLGVTAISGAVKTSF